MACRTEFVEVPPVQLLLQFKKSSYKISFHLGSFGGGVICGIDLVYRDPVAFRDGHINELPGLCCSQSSSGAVVLRDSVDEIHGAGLQVNDR